MAILHCERTVQGVTVVVAPGDGPVTAEAWVGGGSGDERAGERGLAHLAEHVALAMAGADARRDDGPRLDGWVTPDATVFRAIAPARRGALEDALDALASAARPSLADDDVVDRERARTAREGDGEQASRVSTREVKAWWRASYRASRTTIAVRGGARDAREVVRAVEARWRAPEADSASGDGPRGVAEASAAHERDRAALAVAAAAIRQAGASAELVATRRSATWIADDSTVEALVAGLDERALAWAKAAARLPLAGVEGFVSELGAGQHLFGDPTWATRQRALIARVTRNDVLTAMRTRRAVFAQRGPGAPKRARGEIKPVRPVRLGETKRATLASGTRIVAVRVPEAARVAVRVAWEGGFAHERAAERGIVAVIAAAAPAACAEIDAAAETAALGGELAGVAGRWSFGLRSRWPLATWRDGLELVAACARSPRLDQDVVAHERERLVALATGVAQSPSRIAYLAYLRARWGAHPLGIDVLASPAELAAITRAATAEWWREHYAPANAVVVVAGDVDPDEAIALVRKHFETARAVGVRDADAIAPMPVAPSVPEQRELFVDGPAGAAAIVIGLPGLAADDADRRALDGLVAILADPSGRLRRAVAPVGVRAVRARAIDGRGGGYVVLEMDGVPPADAALAAAEGVVRALATDGPTAAEVALAVAALAPPDEPQTIADTLARAELGGIAPAPAAPVDAAALRRVAATVLRWDDAVIVTVRPPDMTPGARAHATKPIPPRRSYRSRAPRKGTP